QQARHNMPAPSVPTANRPAARCPTAARRIISSYGADSSHRDVVAQNAGDQPECSARVVNSPAKTVRANQFRTHAPGHAVGPLSPPVSQSQMAHLKADIGCEVK